MNKKAAESQFYKNISNIKTTCVSGLNFVAFSADLTLLLYEAVVLMKVVLWFRIRLHPDIVGAMHS